MNPEIIQKITTYLEDAKTSMGRATSFKELVCNEELKEETQALKELLNNPTTFAAKFKLRCQKRARSNSTSYLSFISSPEGACNTLYWNIAKLIFNMETLSDLITLTLPEVNALLTVEYAVNVHVQGKASSKTNVSLVETGLETLRKLPADPNLLKYYTTANHLLFDIRTISNFDFNLHTQFYKLINSTYPELAEQLYQHNYQFVSLSKSIKQTSIEQTPREVFLYLIKTLVIGGETYTNNPYASPVAQTGYLLAKEYLESLPTGFREEILALRKNTWSKVNIQSLFLDIANGSCIETAAYYLDEILNNPSNSGILDRRIPVSSRKNHYFGSNQHSKSTNPERIVTLLVIPTYWQKKLFPKLRIRTIEDYLNVLFTFSPAHYEFFIRYANINPKLPAELATLIAGGILNQYQLAEFDEAILKNLDNLSREHVLCFAIAANNVALIERVLAIDSSEVRWQLLTNSVGQKGELLLSRLLKISQERDRDLQIITSALSQEANLAIELIHLIDKVVMGLKEEKAEALRDQANALIYTLGNEIDTLEIKVQRISQFLNNAHAILGYRNAPFSQKFHQIGIGVLIFLAINAIIVVVACTSPVSFALATGLSLFSPQFIGIILASVSFHALLFGLPLGALASYGFFKTEAPNAKKIDQLAEAASKQWNLNDSMTDSSVHQTHSPSPLPVN